MKFKRAIYRAVHSAGLRIYCLPANMTVPRGDGTILRKYRRGFGWMQYGHFQALGTAMMAWATRRNKTPNAEVTRPAASGRSGEPKASEG